jgi:hypothetical protein
MSSQSTNAATYSGYQLTPTSSSISGLGTLFMLPIPARDASDITRAIREQIRYNEFKTGNTISPGNTDNPWIPYGNGFRLSYLHGKLKCGACSNSPTPQGNIFSGNGPYVNNVGGIASS